MRGFCFANVGDCKSFTVTEVGAQLYGCFEQITLDLGAPAVLQRMDTEFSGATNATLAISLDGFSFQSVAVIQGSPPGIVSVPIANLTARYARMRYVIDYTSASDDWIKVRVNDIQLFGFVPASPPPCPNNCSGRGSCNSSRLCACASGYGGADCSLAPCMPPCANGRCVDGSCECSAGFRGQACDTAFCPNDCWGHGACLSGQCQCSAGWSGNDCRYSWFNGTNSARGVLLLDYNQRVDNITAVKPPALSGYYYNQFLGPGCNASLPFVCADGACAKSKGACSLRACNASSNWTYDPYAIVPLTARNGTRVVTSSNQAAAYKVIDGNDGANGFWQSGQCYPLGYFQNPQTNILLGACAAGRCQSAAGGAAALTAATDGDTNTAVGIPVTASTASIVFDLNPSTSLAAVSVKLSVPTMGVGIVGLTATGQRILLGNVTLSYSQINFDLSNVPYLVSVQLESSKSYSVFEMSARSGPCSEFATVDLGRVVAVAALTVRHWAGVAGVNETLYEASEDGVEWILLRGSLPPLLMGDLDTVLSPAVSLRYLRVRHVLQERTSVRVYVWEVTIWDEWGKYGPRMTPNTNPVNFRDLLGVNGIWSWGGAGWSNLARTGWGPKRFSGVASHARNYHNWNWDVDNPNLTPSYEAMSCGQGTEANWWLSWDWEYAGWNAAGLEVDASITFTPSMFAQSLFKSPYSAGYNYGFAFAKHFGRTYGVGLVTHIEVGNEPWVGGSGYADPVFYSDVLLGMARGAKDADPTMRVLPAVFASADVPPRVNATHLQYLDAFNVHAYSYSQTLLGTTGVYPEHPMSTLNEVDWMLRFRDANAPGLPVYLTEWGWDSAGGGEGCGPPPDRAGEPPFPQCVTEAAQALYAVRGALMLARKGLARLTWYFYGNQIESGTSWDEAQGLFARSGLVSSSATWFQNKRALYALEVFVSTLGQSHFMGLVREDDTAYVYLLGDGNMTITHVVAWRPVDAGDNSTANISFSFAGRPAKAWQLGLGAYAAAGLPRVSNGTWTMQVSGMGIHIRRHHRSIFFFRVSICVLMSAQPL